MNKICADIKCPFFTSETDKGLSCEGPGEYIKNTMRFQRPEDKLRYIEEFCTHYPNSCHICAAALKKYE